MRLFAGIFLLLLAKIVVASTTLEEGEFPGLLLDETTELVSPVTSDVPALPGLGGPRIIGVTEPVRDVSLGASVTGRISEHYVTEGQRVSEGDTLVGIESLAEQLEVKRRLLLWKDTSELDAARKQTAIYQTLYENAKTLHDESGAVSGDELKEKQLQYLLQSAKTDLLFTNEKREELEYHLAQETLNKHLIKAPFSGVVTSVWFVTGESAQANKPILRLVDSSKGRFVANVEEAVARQFEVKQPVVLNINAGESTLQKQGRISFISPVTDPASNLIQFIVLFDNQDGAIKLGVSGYMETIQ
ncbi:efflux RND transporter periplasmic adaptor subunit [Parendozoicomonas sp. Alg238-R29]|uniref:efflux RND transporter periplasmic adaptor subunit n=1 Tax=Parendozoicomonas sp. Alg238-R29 TaxID=2993446 RepID=UPI00248DF472|nr:efflux RND transporter periplasmic adaptor subunit [Parendozoicomonas sp. Alg238-R29]